MRSKQYAVWVKQLKAEIHPHSLQLRAFFNSYKPKFQEIHAELIIHNPELYTANKTISQRSGDIDNLFKPIADNLFVFGIDDSQITRLSIAKLPSDFWQIEISLKIIDR